MAGRVVVVSAHPDDETLGLGGILQQLHRGGAALELVIATDGEAAFADTDAAARARLAGTRRRELYGALDRLGLGGVEVTWLGLPDSQLDRETLAAALRPRLAGASACLAPWPNDPHRDHRAAGLAAWDAAGPGIAVWTYPIWTWAWRTPEAAALPWGAAARHCLDEAQLARKRAALDEFASQMGPGPDGGPAVVGAAVRAHFDSPAEVVFRLAARVTTDPHRFEEIYAAGPDPWDTESSFYERRKRELTLASLPRARYRHALDAACGSGVLTAALAARAERVTAVDAVAAAVEAARDRGRDTGRVRVAQGRLPGDLPCGPFDLLVFSEILYYLDPGDLAATLDRAEAACGPGADLVAVDWRPATADAPRDGDDAHRQLLARPGWSVLAEYRQEEFVLHVLRRL